VVTKATSASDGSSPGEVVYYDSTRLGFLPIGVLVAVPIVLLLTAFGLHWWLAVLVTLPVTMAVSYVAMPRRRLRLGQDFLGLREARRPEVLIALHDISEIERVWVLRAGYHLEFRTESAAITLLGLGDFSRPFLHEIGARLARTASPQLRMGTAEQDLLGLLD
jgi:hypothetical protein